MQLQDRINAFVKLGDFIRQFSNTNIQKDNKVEHNDLFFDGFKHQLKLAEEHNGWFTTENLRYALNSWAIALTQEQLTKWLQPYKISGLTPKTVAVIMAGNIPLVGFHDFLAVLITGHQVLVKQSSNDKHLLPFLAKYLEYVAPEFKGYINFTEKRLENFDAVIATGSNNTARYFEYYFKDKPSIIRNNRNSVAVLTGNESSEDLKNLSEDIFRYYGLGCRNVSKLFVPNGYDFKAFFEAMYHWHPIIEKAKYANNYDYNKAVYLMSEFDMLENGFFMIKEDKNYASPIATVFYEYYDTAESIKTKLIQDQDQIQCIVANGCIKNEVPFGATQKPQLWDYADSVDSVKFLLSI
ncbi:acyl-CoA reductase [Hyunsoonleella pacifica]|uniref:Acyl-CoA reductase n=1 Tax=Hyunsoonleella pacifica TaxID=1080224 RepID=A0A4Q9FRC8_9FLAO|nr:acyl-CoA reductase [Hyunsoonleella pacifica]TBN17934.1 acyl-CoA reductase [Hyunsoonleella pacifica]GGD12188.1 acyl-CoA reductase [Hyunsoonleella pacifica]